MWSWCCPARCWPSGIAHLCPHQRLPAALVQRHRQPGEEGRTAGADRHARGGPGAEPGARRAAADAAQMELAKITAARWENLRKTDSVSAQEADQQSSAYTQSQANLAAAAANVRRLEELEWFKNVYAPFTGVLTRRNVDPGALINAGAGGKELFDFAQVDTLRVFVSVPQAYAPFIKAGVNAAVTLQEFPGQKFDAKVARTAEAIDPATRTLLTEVDVPNRDGRLLPGSFGEVHFRSINVHKVTIP